jgi:hypothetical protein
VWSWSAVSSLAALLSAVGLIAAHFFLSRSEMIRQSWHQRLERWGFREA